MTKGYYLFHEVDGHIATLCEDDYETPGWDYTRDDEAFTASEVSSDSVDAPVHCEVCQRVIYAPLTDDGCEYVLAQVRETLVKLGGLNEGETEDEWLKEFNGDLQFYVRHHYGNADWATVWDTDDEETIIDAYVTAMHWTAQLDIISANNPYGETLETLPLDSETDVDDIPRVFLDRMARDARKFARRVEDYVPLFPNASALTPDMLGHDYCLTRNRHGAGFWDRGLGELGDYLSTTARDDGESSLRAWRTEGQEDISWDLTQ